MMDVVDQLSDLPITPLGLAGISVGEDVEAVVARIGEPLVRMPASPHPEEDAEFVEYGPFFVVAVAGIVDAVTAEEGYRGETIGGVYVGMPWSELQQRCPGVSFKEGRFAWQIPGWPRMDLDIRRPTYDDEETESAWADEWYEITDPENAFVWSVAVTLDV